MDADRLDEVERELTTALLAWAGGSVSAGAVIAVSGGWVHRPELVAFGRQTAAWGAIDAVIAGVGVLSRRRRGLLSAAQRGKKASALRTILMVNAVADVGYIAGGLAIMARARKGKATWRMGAGDGAAIVVQGLALLVLDASMARRLGRSSSQTT